MINWQQVEVISLFRFRLRAHFTLLHQDVLLVSITIHYPEVQNRNLVGLLNGEQ